MKKRNEHYLPLSKVEREYINSLDFLKPLQKQLDLIDGFCNSLNIWEPVFQSSWEVVSLCENKFSFIQRELEETIQDCARKFKETRSSRDYIILMRYVNQLKSILGQTYSQLKKRASKLKSSLKKIIYSNCEIISDFLIIRLFRLIPNSGKDEFIINGSYANQFFDYPLILIRTKNEQKRFRIY